MHWIWCMVIISVLFLWKILSVSAAIILNYYTWSCPTLLYLIMCQLFIPDHVSSIYTWSWLFTHDGWWYWIIVKHESVCHRYSFDYYSTRYKQFQLVYAISIILECIMMIVMFLLPFSSAIWAIWILVSFCSYGCSCGRALRAMQLAGVVEDC